MQETTEAVRRLEQTMFLLVSQHVGGVTAVELPHLGPATKLMRVPMTMPALTAVKLSRLEEAVLGAGGVRGALLRLLLGK
jgi:hypothetical protein